MFGSGGKGILSMALQESSTLPITRPSILVRPVQEMELPFTEQVTVCSAPIKQVTGCEMWDTEDSTYSRWHQFCGGEVINRCQVGRGWSTKGIESFSHNKFHSERCVEFLLKSDTI